jgi:hypothetical protein
MMARQRALPPVGAAPSPGIPQPTPVATGPRNARTDTESGVRRYIWKGIEYPSVTSLRRIVGIPFTLHNWILSQHIEGAIDVLPTMGGEPIEVAKRAVRKAGTAKRDRAADLGIRVHASTAAGLVPALAPPDEAPYIAQYQHWLDDQRPQVLLSERQVFNLRLGYGGSFDLLIIDKYGRFVLVDIKTGDGLYLDHVLQLLGYTLADFVGEDDRIDSKATDMLMRVEAMALLHLSPKGWEYVELEADPKAIKAFTSMCHLAHWLDDHKVADYSTLTLTGGIAFAP